LTSSIANGGCIIVAMNGGGPAMHRGFGIRQLRHPKRQISYVR
jgi:hypothetical protein